MVCSNCWRLRLSRRMRSCRPWPGTLATTNPLRWSMPKNCCNSSRVIFCGGNSSSNRSLISSMLIVAVEHLQNGEFFFLKTEVLQSDRIFHHPVRSAQIVLPACNQDRAAFG